MKQKKVKFAIGSVLIIVAIAYLIGSGVSNTAQYFLTVDELVTAGLDTHHGHSLKVKGNVVAGSIQRNPNDYLDVAFKIEEKKSKINVAFKGITPDMFKEGGEVVVEGKLSKDNVFHANTLLTSCPSKYEAEKEAGKTHPGTMPNLESKEGMGASTTSVPKTKI